MSKTRSSLWRAGSAMALTAALLAGCGDDDSDAEDVDVEETSEDGADSDVSEDADVPDGDQGENDDDSGEDSSEEGDAGEGDDGDVETFEVTIAGGEVSPLFATYEVAFGADVRIEVTSDVADELHLHGYDLELELEPGEPGVMEFTADIEGRFELETHDLGLQLLQLEVG